MHAVRNISLCTKDCLCLFVCPTGATDTEDGQIDFSKCLQGCRLCVDACPSHALYLVPDNYAPQQEKSEETVKALLGLVASKTEQERVARQVAANGSDPTERQVARAMAMSCRIMAEDCLREAGYMLPHTERVRALLREMLERVGGEAEIRSGIETLLDLVS
jgi:NAD-dependent dihydropyrimidine dehydrogenase PreA subunit